MTSATAQANPNLALALCSQGNTIYGYGEAGYPPNLVVVEEVLPLISTFSPLAGTINSNIYFFSGNRICVTSPLQLQVLDFATSRPLAFAALSSR